MAGIEELEKEIQLIKDRNKRVEQDKAWETSLTRKVSIALITYLLISIFFVIIKVENPFVNAIVPTIGFLLSTLSLNFIKKSWIKHIYGKY
ncbi:MAG TPA: hypothetical protein VHA74_00530 [Candidatus Dojkabacteria bacterium]|nr:hypothetical protein [Candidatus Dojkabacteria bacterium]